MNGETNSDPDDSIDDAWKKLIGGIIETPEGYRGTIVDRAGDWTTPERRGWFVVEIPNVGKRIYRISGLQFSGDDGGWSPSPP